MGIGASCREDEATVISNEIDRNLKKVQKENNSTVKILLLGASESGKSTVMKQMQIIHNGNLDVEECQKYRREVCSNILECIFSILQAMSNLNIEFEDAERVFDEKRLHEITEGRIDKDLTLELGEIISRLWNDGGVQLCFTRSREYQLGDSASYFLNAIGRICKPNYTPTQDDILRIQVPTTGITESKFQYGDISFQFFDVGGQRSERKKWLHCFDDVNAIIFCAALSSYDLVLREKKGVNRMTDSLNLFESVCNNKWFVNTDIILFLNKKDVFEEKLKTSPLKNWFPNYSGSNNFNEGCMFILEKFENENKNKVSKTVYSHLTCATDTNNIQFVFKAVKSIILNKLYQQGKLS